MNRTILHKDCKKCGSPMQDYRHRERDGGYRNSWYCPKCQRERIDAKEAAAPNTSVARPQIGGVNLLLRPTIIAGDLLPDDYCVIHEGRSVGRVRLADERSWQGTVWTWNINIALPIPSWCNGSADSLEAAKAEFKAAWERFYASLTPEDIESWHRTEDLAKANASWLEK